jgi:hypothetical protein
MHTSAGTSLLFLLSKLRPATVAANRTHLNPLSDTPERSPGQATPRKYAPHIFTSPAFGAHPQPHKSSPQTHDLF